MPQPQGFLGTKMKQFETLRLSFQLNPLDFILCALPKETAWNLLAYILPLVSISQEASPPLLSEKRQASQSLGQATTRKAEPYGSK